MAFFSTRNVRLGSVIGYLILASGTAIALHRSDEGVHQAKAASAETQADLSDAKAKGINIREVLCEGLTEEDLELYKFVKDNPQGSGGIGDLLTPELEKKALEKSASKRARLGYAPRPAACSPTVTPNPYAPKKAAPPSRTSKYFGPLKPIFV